MTTDSYRQYNTLPPQIVRSLVEMVPDLICLRPYIKIDGQLLSTAKTMAIMSSVRDALCFARAAGNAYLYVSKTGEIRLNSVNFFTEEDYNLYPDVVVSFNASYESVDVITPRSNLDMVNSKATYVYRKWKQGSPLITEDVCAAYSLFRNAQERAFLRLKNGNGTLLTLTEGEDDDEQITPELIKSIDNRYDIQNRMYAPDGAKLTGTSVSLDGIEAVLNTFWENIFRAAVIPPWAYEKQQLNSSFTIEHMIKEKERLFFKEVYPVLFDILSVFVPESKISIDPPDFAPEKYRQEVNLLKADVRVRNADVQVKVKSNQVADFEMDMAKKEFNVAKKELNAAQPVSPENKKDVKKSS